MRGFKNEFAANHLGLGAVLAAMGFFLALWSPVFLSTANFVNIGNQIAVNLIIASGITLVICSGGTDLSVGSNVALTGIVAALWFRTFGSGPAAILTGIVASLGVGAAVGALNAALINRIGIPPFIATIGTMISLRGFALILSKGRVFYGLPPAFQGLFSGFWFGVPKPVVVAAAAVLLCAFLLNRTTLGRYARALGGNEECARVSGTAVERHKTLIYGTAGVLAALSGLTLTAMMNAAEPIAGNFYELDAVAVVVMGGTSLSGGSATMLGTVLGAVLLGVVRNGLNLLQIPVYYHQLMMGFVILFAVLVGALRRR